MNASRWTDAEHKETFAHVGDEGEGLTCWNTLAWLRRLIGMLEAIGDLFGPVDPVAKVAHDRHASPHASRLT